MPSNPMQKKARNSFLLGVIITLIICLIIGGLFYFFVIAKDKQSEKQRGAEVIAYALNADVRSGQEITSNLLTKITVYQNMVPSNYIDQAVLSEMQSQEEGQLIAKVNMYKNTILTKDLVSRSDQKITDDVRYTEYNMLSLPTSVKVGDYVDVRITFPNGLDLIVISKGQIKKLFGDTIGLELSEDEILMMESAIVEAYIMPASKLYVTQYVEPGNQSAALNTYTPTEEVQALIKSGDNNIQQEAKDALAAQFNDGIRTNINNDKSQYNAEELENIEKRLEEEIENAKAAREAYLSGLTSY